MTIEDALELGLFAVIIVVAFQNDDFIGAPFADRERARTCRLGLQPCVGIVGVVFVVVGRRNLLGVFFEELLVDDSSDGRGQAVQHEAWCIRLVDGEDEGSIVNSFRLFVDVILGQAELGQDEGRALVETHGAFEGISHVSGGNRVAGSELDVLLQLERIGETIVGNGPAFSDARYDFRRVVDIEANEHVISVADEFGRAQFEGFCRVQRDRVIDGPCLNQRVGWRGRPGWICGQYGGKCCTRSQNTKTSEMHHVESPLPMILFGILSLFFRASYSENHFTLFGMRTRSGRFVPSLFQNPYPIAPAKFC